MSWSDAFRSYIDRRFGTSAQQKAAIDLGVSPSAVSYWCRGSRPREAKRQEIEAWSGREVPAHLPNRCESGEHASPSATSLERQHPANEPSTGTDG